MHLIARNLDASRAMTINRSRALVEFSRLCSVLAVGFLLGIGDIFFERLIDQPLLGSTFNLLSLFGILSLLIAGLAASLITLTVILLATLFSVVSIAHISPEQILLIMLQSVFILILTLRRKQFLLLQDTAIFWLLIGTPLLGAMYIDSLKLGFDLWLVMAAREVASGVLAAALLQLLVYSHWFRLLMTPYWGRQNLKHEWSTVRVILVISFSLITIPSVFYLQYFFVKQSSQLRHEMEITTRLSAATAASLFSAELVKAKNEALATIEKCCQADDELKSRHYDELLLTSDVICAYAYETLDGLSTSSRCESVGYRRAQDLLAHGFEEGFGEFHFLHSSSNIIIVSHSLSNRSVFLVEADWVLNILYDHFESEFIDNFFEETGFRRKRSAGSKIQLNFNANRAVSENSGFKFETGAKESYPNDHFKPELFWVGTSSLALDLGKDISPSKLIFSYTRNYYPEVKSIYSSTSSAIYFTIAWLSFVMSLITIIAKHRGTRLQNLSLTASNWRVLSDFNDRNKNLSIVAEINQLSHALERMTSGFNQTYSTLQEAKADLSSQSKLLSGVFETVPVSLLVLDCEYAPVMWNKALTTVPGVSPSFDPSNERSSLVFSFKKQPSLTRLRKSVFNAARNGRPSESLLLQLSSDSGEIRSYTVSVNPLTNSESITGVIIVAEDITELMTSRDNMMHASKLATLGEMAAAMAHEINQPLTVVRAASENIELSLELGQPDTETLKKKLQRIQEQVDRAAKIIGEMKVLSSKQPRCDEPFEPHRHLVQTLELFEQQVRLTQLTLNHRFSETVGLIEVLGDAAHFEQAVINIVNNALQAISRYRESEGEIDVFEYTSGQTYVVEISDNGGGISDQQLSRIFEPFFTTKFPGEGTGLGLSISYSCIKNMGGDLKAENSANGAKFTIRLPTLHRGLTKEMVATT